MPNIVETVRHFGLKAIPVLKVRGELLQESQLSLNFIVLTLSSCLIATCGLLVNSAAAIIGAMIVAPLMLPIRGFAFAILEGDIEMLRRSAISIAAGTFIGISGGALIGSIVGLPEFGSEVLGRTEPTLIDLIVALVAGGIGGFAKIRPSLSDAVPGTAIAVALMPPLCVVGLTLSQGELAMSTGAFLLYATNLVGINLACTLVYVLSGYTRNNQFNRTLSWGVSFAIIGLLAIPLGISLIELVGQSQVSASVQKILVARPLLDREDIQISDLAMDWNTKPPTILLSLKVASPIEEAEVVKIEQLVTEELDRPFKLIVDYTPARRVESPTVAPEVGSQ